MPILKECIQIDVQATFQGPLLPTYVQLSFPGSLIDGRAEVQVLEPIGPVQTKAPIKGIEAIVRAFLGPDIHVWQKPISQGVYPLRNQCERFFEVRNIEELSSMPETQKSVDKAAE